jgi:hypothetical protein
MKKSMAVPETELSSNEAGESSEGEYVDYDSEDGQSVTLENLLGMDG